MSSTRNLAELQSRMDNAHQAYRRAVVAAEDAATAAIDLAIAYGFARGCYMQRIAELEAERVSHGPSSASPGAVAS